MKLKKIVIYIHVKTKWQAANSIFKVHYFTAHLFIYLNKSNLQTRTAAMV